MHPVFVCEWMRAQGIVGVGAEVNCAKHRATGSLVLRIRALND